MVIVVVGGVEEDDETFQPPDSPVLLPLELREPSRLRRLALGLLNGNPERLGVLPLEPPCVRLRGRKRPTVDPIEESRVLVRLRLHPTAAAHGLLRLLPLPLPLPLATGGARL